MGLHCLFGGPGPAPHLTLPLWEVIGPLLWLWGQSASCWLVSEVPAGSSLPPAPQPLRFPTPPPQGPIQSSSSPGACWGREKSFPITEGPEASQHVNVYRDSRSHGAFGEGPSGAVDSRAQMRKRVVQQGRGGGLAPGVPPLGAWSSGSCSRQLFLCRQPPREEQGWSTAIFNLIAQSRLWSHSREHVSACTHVSTPANTRAPVAHNTGKRIWSREPTSLGLQSVSPPNSYVGAYLQGDGSWRWGPRQVIRFLQDVIHAF